METAIKVEPTYGYHVRSLRQETFSIACLCAAKISLVVSYRNPNQDWLCLSYKVWQEQTSLGDLDQGK